MPTFFTSGMNWMMYWARPGYVVAPPPTKNEAFAALKSAPATGTPPITGIFAGSSTEYHACMLLSRPPVTNMTLSSTICCEHFCEVATVPSVAQASSSISCLSMPPNSLLM